MTPGVSNRAVSGLHEMRCLSPRGLGNTRQLTFAIVESRGRLCTRGLFNSQGSQSCAYYSRQFALLTASVIALEAPVRTLPKCDPSSAYWGIQLVCAAQRADQPRRSGASNSRESPGCCPARNFSAMSRSTRNREYFLRPATSQPCS